MQNGKNDKNDKNFANTNYFIVQLMYNIVQNSADIWQRIATLFCWIFVHEIKIGYCASVRESY